MQKLTRKKMWFGFVLLLFLSGCSSTPPGVGQAVKAKYTAHNIWYKKSDVLAINIQTGAILPAGTEITELRITYVKHSRAIAFRTVETRKRFLIRINPRYQAKNLSPKELINRFITTKSFAELTEGLSQKEIDNIKSGTVFPGMSKRAVIISLGYPPKHKTPSTNSMSWRYWKTGRQSYLVNFDSSDRVAGGNSNVKSSERTVKYVKIFYLNNGTTYEGRIIEQVPSQQTITIKTVTGEIIVLKTTNIARIVEEER